MRIIERLGWFLIASAHGYNARCPEGHVIPRGVAVCTFCVEWCTGCDGWVPRARGLRDVHWPHPRPPSGQTLTDQGGYR